MAGLKEVRIRIASVRSTQQITNAMKMVAASKLRKAQNAILRLRPYAARLRDIMQNLSSSIGDTGENAFSKVRPPEKILMVVITSNRGMCGGFNSNIIKACTEQIFTVYRPQYERGNLSLITIGRKATEFYRKRGFKVLESHDEIFDTLTFENVAPLAEKLMDDFVSKKYDRILIIYNQFKNAAVQRLIIEQFLPVMPPEENVNVSEKVSKTADYIFEPDQETIIRELIPKTLRIQLYKAILDSFASEQGARMTAMQKATENARELLKILNISYNKARQNAITNELLEIVAGAEALKG